MRIPSFFTGRAMAVFLLVSSMLPGCDTVLHEGEKINGVSYVAGRKPTSKTQVRLVKELHGNYAAIMPFGFVRGEGQPELFYNNERQWFGERADGVRQYVSLLHKEGIAVMIKPQIWIGGGQFTGDLGMSNEAQWKLFEEQYQAFILDHARLSAELNVEIFCIGTELFRFIANRPVFFRELIAKVRAVFPNKITYAANWDRYADIPFWDDLDFIGVDAYFPLSEDRTPSAGVLADSWQEVKNELEALSEKHQKPVLFTEYGYRSIDQAAREPWRSDRIEGKINMTAQQNALQAVFEVFWEEDWFAGGFLWKWFPEHEGAGGIHDNRFTIQNKPAEETVRAYYKKW
ncbi:glycoside hydrolase family 113 [Robertkochia aurantiaca]|uniref:glycoside hydrolase family 113 n=1 Tax=Robertkochia aurantiaca TaxID=2873700 RepID=UPI001CCD861B|nr:glycoside hydrolase [Robertkochia sp. 3YJGBD-33]